MGPEDKNNFSVKIDNWLIIMSEGVLYINDVNYEENEDDPTYAICRAYWVAAKDSMC